MKSNVPEAMLQSKRFLWIAACIVGNIMGTVLMVVLSERTLSLRPALNQIASYMEFRVSQFVVAQYLQYLLENRGLLFVTILVCVHSVFERWFLAGFGFLAGFLLAVSSVFSVMIWGIGGILVMAGASLPHMLLYGASVYMLLQSRDGIQSRREDLSPGSISPGRWIVMIVLWLGGIVAEWQICPRVIEWVFWILGEVS